MNELYIENFWNLIVILLKSMVEHGVGERFSWVWSTNSLPFPQIHHKTLIFPHMSCVTHHLIHYSNIRDLVCIDHLHKIYCSRKCCHYLHIITHCMCWQSYSLVSTIAHGLITTSHVAYHHIKEFDLQLNDSLKYQLSIHLCSIDYITRYNYKWRHENDKYIRDWW